MALSSANEAFQYYALKIAPRLLTGAYQFVTILLFLVAFAGCAVVINRGQHLVEAVSDEAIEHKLISAKLALMSADYRADLDRLASVRKDLEPLRDDPRSGYVVDYWTGYASWRLAINGVGRHMPVAEVQAHLTEAVVDFETAAALRVDFADAIAAAASVHAWLGSLLTDSDATNDHYRRSAQLLARSLELEANNPRVLWVQASFYLFNSKEQGGDPSHAEKIYEQQLRVSPNPDPQSFLPDWGKAEAWMSLAYAHLNQETPNLEAAQREANMALELEPDWYYVRSILVPQIENAASTQKKAAPSYNKH